MNEKLISEKFEAMGARVQLRTAVPRQRSFRPNGPANINILEDKKGQFFDIALVEDAGLEVVDLRPRERHLLLLLRQGRLKDKFLCGHDEREWFVAAIPDGRSASDVRTAMEALKPPKVIEAQAKKKLKKKHRNKRRNRAYKRQGEWFFIPAAIEAQEMLILRNEPLSRGTGSKLHMAQYCFRSGGVTVYVCSRYPGGVTQSEYRKILSANKGAGRWGWQTMQRDAGVYVKGAIRHPDHATLVLRTWHRVEMNTENRARAMRHVRFLD